MSDFTSSELRVALFAPSSAPLPAFVAELRKVYEQVVYRINPQDAAEDYNLSIVLGGDGTFVRACRTLPEVPVMGFHAGTLGFLTPHDVEHAENILQGLYEGRYAISNRQTLQIGFPNSSLGLMAVNDIVFQRQPQDAVLSFSIEFQADEGTETISDLKADGLIISTATGSTAYNMSAGGSILHPMLRANILTPICPLSPGFRSLVYPSERYLKVRALNDRTGVRSFFASLDGQVPNLFQDETFIIGRGPELQVIRVEGCKHFVESAQSKLNWAR